MNTSLSIPTLPVKTKACFSHIMREIFCCSSWIFVVKMIKLSCHNNLGKALRNMRKSRRLTQTDVAKRSGLSVPTIRGLENGRGNLTSWNKVLLVLDVTLAGRNLPPGDSIGSQIAELRRRRDLGQRSLASIVGTTQPSIVMLERMSSGRLDVLDRVLGVLGSGAYLLPKGQKKSFFTHAGNSSINHSWRTPQWLLQKLYSVFGEFDLDPCSPSKRPSESPVRARIGEPAFLFFCNTNPFKKRE